MTGSVFISYSDDHLRIEALATALRRYGMRTWRDVEALPLGIRTRSEIETELAVCKASIIWLTHETLASEYVRLVELPTIFAEHDRRGLIIIPIFVDWSPGGDASAAVRAAVGREISDHNGHHFDCKKPIADEMNLIARRFARSSLQECVQSDPSHRPIIRCVTRTDAATGLSTADINLNWIAEYPSSGELPDAPVESNLQRALSQVGDELIGAFGAGSLDVHARCHLHLAVALGHTFRKPTGMLPRLLVDNEWWGCETLSVGQEFTPLRQTTSHGPIEASRAAVELSITQDVRPGVDSTIMAQGTLYRSRTVLQPVSGPGQMAVTDPIVANAWADQTAEVIRSAGREPGITDVDLFVAAPIQFALFLGWRLNAAGRVHIHHWVGNTGPYRRVWSLPPS